MFACNYHIVSMFYFKGGNMNMNVILPGEPHLYKMRTFEREFAFFLRPAIPFSFKLFCPLNLLFKIPFKIKSIL